MSSVYGFRRGLELGVLGDGGSGWLKSVSLAQKLIIIESACAKGGMVVQANADGIYDTRDNFNTLDRMGITPCIKIRENASTRARGCHMRKRHVREYKQLGYKKWRDKYRYGYRWRVEGNLSAVKRLAGEYVTATEKNNMYKEVAMKFLFYNSIIKYDITGESPWTAKTCFVT